MYRKLIILVLLFFVGCNVPITPTPETTAPVASDTPAVTLTAIETATPSPTDNPPAVLPVMKIGLNVNGQALPNKSLYLDFVRQTCAPQLIMDNFALALEVYHVLVNGCQIDNPLVIHRNFSSQEGGECTQTPAAVAVNRWTRENMESGDSAAGAIIRYSVNEPVYNEATWVTCLNREREVMRLARAAGITVSMSNFPVGAIQPQWIESGLFDDYLRDLDTYGHYLGAHEYTSAVLSFGVGQWAMNTLLSPAAVAPANWAQADEIPIARQAESVTAQVANFRGSIDTGSPFGAAALDYHYGLLARNGISAQGALGTTLPPYWHLRRADWFLLRADTIGVPRPRILITEGLHDHLDDINAVLDPLEALYGQERYLWDLRGIPSMCDLWAFYWDNWTCAQAAFEQLKHANEQIYPHEEYAALLIFTCSLSDMWIAFDVCHNQVGRDLQGLLIGYANDLRGE